MFQNEIQNIINNNNLIATEQLKKLDALLNKCVEEIDSARTFILKDYQYCCKCNDYYKRSSWEHGKTEKNKTYYECPKGHKFIDNYGC